jgi:acetyl-CoA acetyltransferase
MLSLVLGMNKAHVKALGLHRKRWRRYQGSAGASPSQRLMVDVAVTRSMQKGC